ncbi:MAG: NADH-quinone oxidoreductase subunit L, partial [Halorientalis sp.]
MATETVTAYAFVPAIAALPFVSFLVSLLFGRYMPKGGALAGIFALAGSLLISIASLLTVAGILPGETAYHATIWHWVTGINTFDLHLGVYVDPLSALMLTIVSLIALLVFIFSLGYMNDEGETGLARYYAALSLFSFSMLAFVFSDNILMAFMFF